MFLIQTAFIQNIFYTYIMLGICKSNHTSLRKYLNTPMKILSIWVVKLRDTHSSRETYIKSAQQFPSVKLMKFTHTHTLYTVQAFRVSYSYLIQKSENKLINYIISFITSIQQTKFRQVIPVLICSDNCSGIAPMD